MPRSGKSNFSQWSPPSVHDTPVIGIGVNHLRVLVDEYNSLDS
jgi:hypothetical protein